MEHSYEIVGKCFKLRPINNQDVNRLIELRSNNNRTLYLNHINPTVESQLKWLSDYYGRNNDYYFAVQRISDENVEGFISLYDIDNQSRAGEFGRWILDENSNAALESAHLIYKFAFDVLSLDVVFCKTLVDNKKVVSLHDSYGAKREGILQDELSVNGELKSAVKHVVSSNNWGNVSNTLNKYIDFLVRKMSK